MTNITMERAALCALNRIMGYEPALAHCLIDNLGSATSVFRLSKDEKFRMSGPFSKFAPLLEPGEIDRSGRELSALQDRGIDFITIRDQSYPALLKECDDAPIGLYVRSGTPVEELFDRRPQIAVVGTRDISLYGKEWCRKMVCEMACAPRPPLIVSGFALGTDIIAHSTALECGLPTVAVLPTGIDSVYPWSHNRWAGRIDSTPGCALVTDYPPGTKAIAINFLRRNRIIAGLCSATVLIESKNKGGGLITANFAFNYNRDVFALPGRVDDIRSQGCNRLIRSLIAEPVGEMGALMKDLGLGVIPKRSKASLEEAVRKTYSDRLIPSEVGRMVAVALFFKKKRGATPEEAAEELKCSFQEASVATAMLEADGFIESDLLGRCVINVKKV